MRSLVLLKSTVAAAASSLATASYRVVHLDAALLVVDKDPGLLTVPGIGPSKQDSLMTRLQVEFPTATTVHRLDRDTSGLVVFALTPQAHRCLAASFQARTVAKRYRGLCSGVPPAFGSVEAPIGKAPAGAWPRMRVESGGRPSVTRFRRLETDGQLSLLELEPVTGRQQQIRVHLAYSGWPLLGDELHGGPSHARLCLHATSLELEHPSTGERVRFGCPAEFSL